MVRERERSESAGQESPAVATEAPRPSRPTAYGPLPVPVGAEKLPPSRQGHRRPFPRERDGAGLPIPPVADADPVPRVIADFERAPPGRRRYKVRALNMVPAVTRYVLAASADDARKAYLDYLGSGVLILPDETGQRVPPALFVVELPD